MYEYIYVLFVTRDESDDVVEVCPETPKDVPDKSSDVKGNNFLQLILKAIIF